MDVMYDSYPNNDDDGNDGDNENDDKFSNISSGSPKNNINEPRLAPHRPLVAQNQIYALGSPVKSKDDNLSNCESLSDLSTDDSERDKALT